MTEIATRQHETFNYRSEHGRSSVEIKCPFCGARVRAYIWSLRGSGKKCHCGAIHTGSGYTYAPQEKKKEVKNGIS